MSLYVVIPLIKNKGADFSIAYFVQVNEEESFCLFRREGDSVKISKGDCHGIKIVKKRNQTTHLQTAPIGIKLIRTYISRTQDNQ